MEHREEIVLVTGAASGIGNACATYLAKKGYRTYGTCREPSKYEKKADEYFDLLQMDIVDDTSVAKAGESLLAKEGRIDHLVCCAGMGLVGSIEECSLAEARLQFETDYFGTLRTIKTFLPSMREAGSGRIIVATSLAALIGLPFIAHYSAAKRGLEALVESLRYEASPFGIQVCALELGPFKTAFSESLVIAGSHEEEKPYHKAKESLLRTHEREKAEGNAPLAAAKAVYALLEGRHRMPAHRRVGPFSLRLSVLGRRLLATSVSESFIRKLFYTTERKS